MEMIERHHKRAPEGNLLNVETLGSEIIGEDTPEGYGERSRLPKKSIDPESGGTAFLEEEALYYREGQKKMTMVGDV